MTEADEHAAKAAAETRSLRFSPVYQEDVTRYARVPRLCRRGFTPQSSSHEVSMCAGDLEVGSCKGGGECQLDVLGLTCPGGGCPVASLCSGPSTR